MSATEAPASLSPKRTGRGRRWLLTAALLIGLAPGAVAMGAPSFAATTGPSVTAWSDQIVLSHSGTSVTMQYAGVDTDVARFSCSLDGQVRDCSGPSLALTNLADNTTHTFSIRGYDAVGHAGPLFTLKWVVGDIFPDTHITSGPANGAVTSGRVRFEYSSPNDGVSYVCFLDGVQLGAAGADGYIDLFLAGQDGVHTFTVAAVDSEGRVDPTPEARTWIVDNTI